MSISDLIEAVKAKYGLKDTDIFQSVNMDCVCISASVFRMMMEPRKRFEDRSHEIARPPSGRDDGGRE